jgi:hypothetical protein
MGKVIIAHTSDGAEVAGKVEDLLKQFIPNRDEEFEISNDISQHIDSWETAVILFIVTEESIRDQALIDFATRVVASDLPIIPVVERPNYPFYSLPDSLKVLTERNAVSMEPTDGPTLIETVQGYLGLTAFVSLRKVFISYRRSDGKAQAEEIYDYLWNHRIPTFLDTNHIEGGAVVQERIVQEIHDKDLVLLIDSPDVANSRWVAEEIKEAILRRIPVCVVSITNKLFMPLVSGMQRIVWDTDDPQNLEKIHLMVLRSIASRDSFDRRIARTLREVANLKKLTLQDLDTRQFLISQNKLRWFIEYEDAPVSLERLHRLYLGFKGEGRCKGAIFVGGDQPIQTMTSDAVTWARGKHSLEVLPLPELYRMLDQIFP